MQQVILIISICQWIPIILIPQGTLSYIQNAGAQQQYMESESCITYDSTENTIRISCGFADLTGISNQLKNPDLLHKETTTGVWLLDAGIVIEQGATLYINSTDASWLKIAADGETAHAITVLGSLKINSVKISSWYPEANDYLKFEFDILPSREYEKSGIDAIPRPYILVEEEATGTTDITNSELAYLGYTCGGGCYGLTYYGGEGSIVKGNEIHHNRFGFYSKAVGGLILEGNHVHDNFMYGFDPHTGTHDMVIRNNTVHNHGAMGIICSVDCYNITIDGNDTCIFMSQSSNNKVYQNNVSNCETGIDVFHDAAENAIYNNTITNSRIGLGIRESGSGNQIYSNTIIDAAEKPVNIEDSEIEEATIMKATNCFY